MKSSDLVKSSIFSHVVLEVTPLNICGGDKEKKKNNKKKAVEEACLTEIPVREEERGHEGPEEEAQAQPAGAHLHPHSRHAALHGLGAGVWSETGQGGKNESW